jgi:hypothetical protein
MKKIILILSYILTWSSLSAQTRLIYDVNAVSSISPVISIFENDRYLGAKDELKFGYGVFVRGMWHPGRLIAVGVMSGYMHISQDELPDSSKASLKAVPLQAIVSMTKNNFEFAVGIGPYLMMSQIDNGDISYGNRLELGLTVISNYSFELSKQLYISPEMRIVYFNFREIFSIMPTISFKYKIYSY